ncbi:MAG: hypothetical protein AB7G28_24080 [Pirellulales bacterium]
MAVWFPLAGIWQNLAAVRPLYLVVWCGAALLSGGLVLLFRSRWGRKNALYRCAVGSLLVHVLIVGLTMTVRLVVGDGGAGVGPPIYVKLVDDVQREGPITLAAPVEETKAPELLVVEEEAPEPLAKPASDEEAAPAEIAPVVEAPPLMSRPEPAVEKTIVLDEEEDAKKPEAADVAAGPQFPEPVTPIEATPEEATAPASSPPSAIADVAAIAAPATSPYAHRNAPDRLEYAEQHGGSIQTEEAVAAALKWLAERQSEDGRWDADRFGAGEERAVLGQDRGGAGADADSGITALALLAFMGAGHSHTAGDYQTTVAKGLEFIMRGQAGDGHLAANTSLYARMYCHSMASFALAEALAMTGDQRLEPAVRRAVEYSVRAQHPSTGGWRYRPGDLGDTSQLGWQLMSLLSAERAGIKVPPQTWTGAERFLRSVERGRAGGLASYRPDGPPSTPMTAEAMYCRQVVADALSGTTNQVAFDEATAAILALPPEPQRVNLYYWYYATLALHHQQEQHSATAAAWQTWNTALTLTLVNSQLADGPEAGSWEPNCIWGGYGGRVYSTAVAAMCLEVYYRYTDDAAAAGWTASRPNVQRLPQ